MTDKLIAPVHPGAASRMKQFRRRSVVALLGGVGLAAALTPAGAQTENADGTAGQSIVDLLRGGGNVIVHRYTGAIRSATPPALPGSIDDGQRMSAESERLFQAIGDTYRRLGIPVDRVFSSEYFFVHQHAVAAFGDTVTDSRDLTGSLYFSDAGELEASLAALRARTATPPPAGTNTVLVTHQGKFDKAFGIWLPRARRSCSGRMERMSPT